VVIAGQLDDNLGTHLTVGLEVAAASIHENLFPDGREFRLISYEPRDTLGNSWFRLIEFQHRHISEDPRDPSHYTGAIPSSTTLGAGLRPYPHTEAGRVSRPRLAPP
jgi:hypothetical protein